MAASQTSERRDRSVQAEWNLRQVRIRRQVMAYRKKRVRKRPIPKLRQPDTIRIQYLKMIRAILAVAKAMVQRRVVSVLPELVDEAKQERGDAAMSTICDGIFGSVLSPRTDAGSGKRINALFDDISEAFYRSLSPELMDREVSRVGRQTSEAHRTQFNRQVKAGLGVELGQLPEPGLAGRIEQFTSENVALIKSLPQKYFDDIEKLLTRGVADGRRAEDLAREMTERFGVAESQAKLIARDQVGKLFGDLQMVRQQALGIEKYDWQTSGDERVREEHAQRNGRRFRWDDPPEDGHPGEAINCRCSALPVFDEILEDL